MFHFLIGNSMTSSTDKHYWWIKLDFARHLADMAMLDYEQQGIYQHLMHLTAAGTPIPSDPAKLSKALGVTEESIADLWELVGDRFTTDKKTRTITHTYSYEQRAEMLGRSELGKVGARARWGAPKVVPISGGEK
jgi:hypothetical protein